MATETESLQNHRGAPPAALLQQPSQLQRAHLVDTGAWGSICDEGPHNMQPVEQAFGADCSDAVFNLPQAAGSVQQAVDAMTATVHIGARP